MGFFDRKEEVIEVQLTQYGKHLLSIGKFKPDQYAFFDDDILYDIKHSATGSTTDSGFDSKERSHISEKQNTSETRIKETPRIKTQYNFTDLENRRGTSQSDYQTDCGPVTPPEELVNDFWAQWAATVFTSGTGPIELDTNELQTTNLKDLVESANDAAVADSLNHLIRVTHQTNNFNIYSKASSIANCLYQKRLSDTKYYPYMAPLGNSSLNSDYAPAWSIKFLNGDLLSEEAYGSVIFLSGTNYPDMKIPQLETRVQYDTYVAKKNKDGVYKNNYVMNDIGFSGQLESSEFIPDNTVIQVKSDYLLLEIDELNTDFIRDNFEIEVFKVEETIGINYTNRELTQLYFYDPKIEEDIRPYHVEYYFDLFVDEEIESKFYCNAKNVDKKQNILSDQKIPFNCDDVSKPEFENVYKIEIKESDFEEPC